MKEATFNCKGAGAFTQRKIRLVWVVVASGKRDDQSQRFQAVNQLTNFSFFFFNFEAKSRTMWLDNSGLFSMWSENGRLFLLFNFSGLPCYYMTRIAHFKHRLNPQFKYMTSPYQHHIYLYNNPSYSRIVIGSRLWSIRGQTHRWRQRSIQVFSNFWNF